MIKIPRLKRSKYFLDVRQDLCYAYSSPSWTFRPIFKVKRALKRAYPPIQWFSNAIENLIFDDPYSVVKNVKKLCGHPWRPSICRRLSLTSNLTHFQGQKSPEARIPHILIIFVCYRKLFFGWSGFRGQKCRNYLWTSIKTLAMQPVVPYSKSDSFSRSNELQSAHTPHFDNFRVL